LFFEKEDHPRLCVSTPNEIVRFRVHEVPEWTIGYFR
jgi:hypothetical protein